MQRQACSIKPRHWLLDQAGQQGNAKPGTIVHDSTCLISTAGSIEVKARVSAPHGNMSRSCFCHSRVEADQRHDTFEGLCLQVHNMSVRAKGKLLLESTLLQVTAGRRYGLVGPNGKGKSTLLRLIARRQVPVPDGLDVLLVEQVGNPEGLCVCSLHAESLPYGLDVLLLEQCGSPRIPATCRLCWLSEGDHEFRALHVASSKEREACLYEAGVAP